MSLVVLEKPHHVSSLPLAYSSGCAATRSRATPRLTMRGLGVSIAANASSSSRRYGKKPAISAARLRARSSSLSLR